MAEQVAAPAAPASAPPQPQPELIANKWKDDAAAQQGMRELFKHRNVPIGDNAPVYGDGGMFASRDAAIAFYKAMSGQDTTKVEYAETDIDGLFKAVGLDNKAFGETLVKNRSIDDDAFAKFKNIEVKGADGKVYRLNKDALNSIFVGQVEAAEIKAARVKETQEQVRQNAFQIAGGKQEDYENLMRWAASNLDSDEAKARNAAITGTDTKAALDAVRLVKAKYDEANRGFKAIVGTMPATIGNAPKNLAELKDLNKRAQEGDIVAQRTLKEHMAEINRRFS
jgi:hypothetical protein